MVYGSFYGYYTRDGNDRKIRCRRRMKGEKGFMGWILRGNVDYLMIIESVSRLI